MKIRNQRDFWAGIMFLVTGILFIILSQQYQLGTAAKMGPGYFPTALGGLMAFLGILVSWGATAKSNPVTTLTKVGWRELILVLVGVAAFAFLLPKLGMVLSLIALIGIAAVAGHEFRLRDTLLSVVVLVAVAYGVFVYGLELQFPVWPIYFTR